MRAAEYVRVSTDHQQYSILNQQSAIAEYAALHGFQDCAHILRSGQDWPKRS
jgi:DNA invertase Pin-like site-specific DNA recombinase